MHVLVTGGAGFIGSHLVDYHIEKGDEVVAVDNLVTGSYENLSNHYNNENFHFEEADILTWPDIEKTVQWADRIYHMAAIVGVFKVLEEPINVLSTNIAGTERLLRAARLHKFKPDIVLASTSEVYGNPTERGDLCEDTDLVINKLGYRANYSVSKIADELYGLSYAKQFGMKVRMIRFFNAVGPRQRGKYGMVVPRFVKQASDGVPITVYGEGTQTRCFTDVRDVVVVLNALLRSAKTIGHVFNVGSDFEISIEDLAQMVKQKAGSKSEITKIPYVHAYGEGFDEIYHRKPCLQKLRLALPSLNFEWNIEKTVEDLLERNI